MYAFWNDLPLLKDISPTLNPPILPTTTLTTKDIDESVSFILKLQNKYNIELLDRMNVCFKQGEFIQYKDLKEFKSLLKNRAITKNTIIFDNLISNNHDFKNYWEISIEDSWYNRFL